MLPQLLAPHENLIGAALEEPLDKRVEKNPVFGHRVGKCGTS
jgi:hypothetical protein